MIHRGIWIIIVIALSILTIDTRIQANALGNRVSNGSQYYVTYKKLFEDIGAEEVSSLDRDKRTGYRSAAFKTKICGAPYQIFEQGVVYSLPHAMLTPPLNSQKMQIMYYDKIWDEWDHVGNTLLTLKVSLASIFKLTRFQPSRKLLILIIPDNCSALNEIDWSKVWLIDTLENEGGAS